MPDEVEETKGTLKRLASEMQEAIAAHSEQQARQLAMDALLAINEAAWIYERGAMFKIVEISRTAAHGARPDAASPPGSAAHVASRVTQLGYRLEVELDEDAPNVLSLAEEIGGLMEGLHPPTAEEIKRLAAAGIIFAGGHYTIPE